MNLTERIPTEPAAYWRPQVNLSEVYYLRPDGTWRLSPHARDIAPENVPSDLIFLAHYRTPAEGSPS